jgi:hypothetical protein
VPRALALPLALLALAAGCGDDDGGTSPPAGETRGGGTPELPANQVDLGGGTSSVRLDPLVVGLLEAGGVEVRAVTPATLEDGLLRVPITEGQADLTVPSGDLDHDGGVRFTASGRSVEATALRLEIGASTITAEVDGARAPLFAVRFDPQAARADGDRIVLRGEVRTPDRSVLERELGAALPAGGVTVGRLEVATRRP